MSELARFAAVAEVDADLGLLTAAEVARHDRLVMPADQQAYAAAHVLARECAASLLGTTRDGVVVQQRCVRCGSAEHGAPYVAGSSLQVSLSHARGYVAAVAATRACGIDVEAISRGPDRALSEREAVWVGEQEDAAYAFTRLWVRKEALVKAGHGTMAAAHDLDVLDVGSPADRVGGLGLVEWSGEGFAGAVAVAADVPDQP